MVLQQYSEAMHHRLIADRFENKPAKNSITFLIGMSSIALRLNMCQRQREIDNHKGQFHCRNICPKYLDRYR